MQLALNGLLPAPLRDKLNTPASGLWKQNVMFSKGEYVFVQAPSGTGKTTLLHILYGLRKDYEGNVKWGNDILMQLNENKLSELRSNQVSIIFQDMRLFPELTAWENLSVKRQLTNTVTEDTVMQWMQRLEIGDKKNSLAATLSYGEQQRLAIIRALLQPFDWLLMDEPFSHLDNGNTAKAIQLITEVVQQNGAGILLADLDGNDYFTYSQRIIL